MSKLTEYTIEVYKCDRRVKGSYRLIEKKDFAPVTKDYIDTVAEKFMNDGYIVKIFDKLHHLLYESEIYNLLIQENY